MTKIERLVELQQQLDDILQKMSELRQDVDEVAVCVAEHRFISGKTSSNVIEKLQELHVLNENCRQLYDGIELEEELSTDILHTQQIVISAISKAELDRKYNRFLCIQTKDAETAVLLEEKKSELKSLLQDYSENTEDKNNTEEKLAPFAKFIEALTETDSIKLVSYMMELAPAFGNHLVAKAFMEKTLFLDESIDDISDVDVAEQETKEGVRFNVQDEPCLSVAENSSEAVKSDKTEIFIEDASQDIMEHTEEDALDSIHEVEEADENHTAEIDSPVNYYDEFVKKGMLITEDVFSGSFLTRISPSEKKKFGVKVFIKEMSAKNMLQNIAILKCTEQYNSIVPELVSDIFSMKREQVLVSFEYLVNKGYLRMYRILELGAFYCLSPKAAKAFQAKESRTFLRVKGNVKSSPEEVIEDTVHPVLTRITFAKLFQRYLGILGDETMVTSNMVWTECCGVRIVQKETEKAFAFAGAYWCNAEEAEAFIHDVEECYIEDCESFVVAALNFEIAKKQADILIDMTNLKTDNLYCYSLTDDSFQDYEFGEIYDLEDILYIPDEGAEEAEAFALEINEQEAEASVSETNEEESEASASETNEEESEASASETDEKEAETTYAEWNEASSVSVNENNNSEDAPIVRAMHKPAAECVKINEADNVLAGDFERRSSEAACVHEQVADADCECPLYINIEEVRHNTYQMIVSDKIYCATTYLRSLMDEDSEVKDLYEKLAYAVNAPLMKCSYHSQMVFTLYADAADVFSKYLLTAAAIRNFFMNHVNYDYEMKALHASVKELEMVSSNAPLTKVMYDLVSFKEHVHKGINFYADYKAKDKVALERTLKSLAAEAKSYYNSYVLGHVKENTSHKRFIETRKLIFAQSDDLAGYLNAVAEQDYELVELVSLYLQETFMKADTTIDISNIDYKKLNAFIDDYWNRAGEAMRVAKRTSNLMSSLRSNLLNAIEKVLRVMCEWTSLVEESGQLESDEGSIRYKEARKDLIDNMTNARVELAHRHSQVQLMELAGIVVLEKTLEELTARLDGSFNEKVHKYFYIDFLRGNNVLLNESYLPDMKGKFGDFKELTLANRVFVHSQEPLMSFQEKLEEIFHNYGDDYGTAELIMQYLEDMGEDSFDYAYDIKASQEIAQKDAENKFNDFIENLELAQSYGQIEETRENKKEKIQKITSEWFEYAKASKNYGFFNMVLEMYRAKIQEDAKVRGIALLQELTQIKEKEQPDDRMKAKISKIEEMIERQNYTVAEDLLSRIHMNESDEEVEVLSTDYLKKFIQEYEFIYKNVADSSRKLSAVVSSKIRNKDDKGARKLIENWMSNGQALGEVKLNQLLDALGFSGAKAKAQSKIGKIENYFVCIDDAVSGRKVNYKHPIAAFGSKAREEGFRVVCLFGKYDAERLIEEFKNITGTKNTLVLLDYALPLTERRKLARKIKSDLNDKVYAVIDRVLLLFLVNNYNVQFINRILMNTMMPFAYYQPYIWDSSKVMPPEMFMGRKEELEKIQSPSGVNIVYGGRQLGKSALLKMAKMNIDHDENQNRAVLVEIKGLNHEKAAKKIGHELYDAGILTADIDTTDWDELARAIKRRLNDTKLPYIPYLLLLLDEADAFIDSCESVNYQPFDALKDIQSVGMDRFKFVIAGLHNIVRFKRDAALSNNSVLTHLTSITVKPFDKREAKTLLVEPLSYLGFRFPEEKQALVSLILANTNYFPGLIQLYCANLIESMRKNNYGGYDQANTPVYEINETLIKKVLADADFMNQIREKFEITLKLDEDNMYYLIALLLAYLYHQNANSASESDGFSARDIIDAAKGLFIKKVSDLNEETVNGLLQELLELNILRQTVSEWYLFSRYSFFQMMGTARDVENKLEAYMED